MDAAKAPRLPAPLIILGMAKSDGTPEGGGGLFEVLTRDFGLLFVSGFCFVGSLYIVIPILPLYMIDVAGMSRTQVGIVVAMLTVTSMLARPYLGRKSDDWGRKPLMIFGSLNFVVGSLLFIVARSMVPLLLVLVFEGLGLACFHTAALTFVGDIAPAARRGQSMAWYQTSFNAGIMLAPLFGVFLKEAFGYNSVFIAAAVAALVSFLFALKVSESKAEEVEGRLEIPRVTSTHRRLLVLVCFAAFGGTIVLGAAETFVPVFAKVAHIPSYALFFTVSEAAIIGFRLAGGTVPDIIGRRTAITASVATLGVSLIMLGFATSLWMLCVAAFVYGAGFAYHTPALTALLGDHVPASELGGAFGMFLAAFEGGIAIGAIVTGPLSTAFGFRATFISIGAFALVCAAVVGFSYRSMVER
jgi:MFS family permease